jgi:hypothetical protein
MRRAIDILPAELKPFFMKHQEELVLRVIDPDLWRTLGWPEDPHHFLDFGVKEYGPYPFKELPRDYDAALAKFGRRTLERNGLLPWRQQEIFGNLRRAFETMRRGGTNPAQDIILFSAVMSHYIQDAHQPLHSTINYDGAETGQQGVHARFESELFERFQSRMSISPAGPRPLTMPRDAAFDVLLESFRLVDALLDADRKAIAGRAAYDDVYFESFFKSVKPMMEQQIARAITATASLIMGAWQEAGRPALRLEPPPRPVQKVKPDR